MARLAVTIAGIVCMLSAGYDSAGIQSSSTNSPKTSPASSGSDVQRVTIKNGESYTMRCTDFNSTPTAPDSRRRRAADDHMIYGIILQEAKYHGSGSGQCRESSIVKNLQTRFCVDVRHQECEVHAEDPVEGCGNRSLTVVYTCGLIRRNKGKRWMITDNVLDD
ncbi:uncharacterized protein LOC129590035 isoform X2 [Paramacrobiotus metropolitanus]|uniref:uncharacterized protein LOC129590035 isoform X2 n=1 Tax=Paramacrobiotus metropolitanus TaxID=2943436 RepID=UPI002445A06A|nr:uncharacterized protein LOC129590035 isoform X2 [Paramacrobiotus metropolitanus]